MSIEKTECDPVSTTETQISPADDDNESVGELDTEENFKKLSIALLVFQGIMIIFYAVFTEQHYIEGGNFMFIYQMFTGVLIMMLFGFGYLMTFLKRYGMGAVGFTMLITVTGLQWGILTEGFFKACYSEDWGLISIELVTLLDGLFLVAAVLISFGAVIGKVSPLQLMVMCFLEAIFYSLNKAVLLLGVVDMVDAGGTINIHMFGAYFGLAVAYMLGKPHYTAEDEAGHISDLFSLIGTVFLWVYWPSFNPAALDPNSHEQQRGVVGTMFALSASTVAAFAMSMILSDSWKLRPVDIQNATLAGGVALGAVCHMTLTPSDCMIIGFCGGAVSTYGFNVLEEKMDTLGIHDTCGVHNLHGMPSLIGALASLVLAAYKTPKGHDSSIMHGDDQWVDQLLSIIFTLSVAISSGLITGFLLHKLRSNTGDSNDGADHSHSHTKLKHHAYFSDEPYWEVVDETGRTHHDVLHGGTAPVTHVAGRGYAGVPGHSESGVEMTVVDGDKNAI